MTRPTKPRPHRRNLRIPFTDEMAAAVREGRKTATTRTKAYGKPGDVLQSPAGPIVLDRIEKTSLAVAALCYRAEGFASWGEFVALWKKLHPRTGFNGSQMVYLHRFHRLADEGKQVERRVEA